MAEGKKKESRGSFCATFTDAQNASIRVGCIDCTVLAERRPEAEVVRDRFHIIASLNVAIDEVRCSEWRAAQAEGMKLIKDSQNPQRRKPGRSPELNCLNEGSRRATSFKEQFRLIYSTAADVRSERAKMHRWYATVQASGTAPLVRFANDLLRDLPVATAFFEHLITSGRSEAFNSEVARLIHRACGMTNLKHMFLKMRAQSLKQI